MSMSPFTSRFRELGMKETRVVIFPDEDRSDEGKICLRGATIVMTKPATAVASFSRSSMSLIRAASWRPSITVGRAPVTMPGGWVREDASRDMAGASLDPMLPQSVHSQFFLELFNDVVLRDPAYVERLKRHYAMFKAASPPRSSSRETPNRSWRKQRARLEAPKRRKRPR